MAVLFVFDICYVKSCYSIYLNKQRLSTFLRVWISEFIESGKNVIVTKPINSCH